MMAQVLYNYDKNCNDSEKPDVRRGDFTFTDVHQGAWYSKAITWAYKKGVAAGVGGNRFAPKDPVTREQVVTMIWNYEGKPEPPKDAELNFSDKDEISDYAVKPMKWAVNAGVLAGTDNGELLPQGLANRAQLATIMCNWADMN